MTKGIYKITNKINQKVYIGKSNNIENRWKYHQTRYLQEKEYNKPLYRAFRKYGINNFSFEILEEIDNNIYDIISNEREIFWINYFNSYGELGYNGTHGGDGGITVSNPRETYGKITDEEVIYLRKRYVECKYPASYIWENEFKNKITKRGFQAIWLGQNAKHIMPNIFTEENKRKQLSLSRAYEGVLRRRISLKDKQNIKNRIKNGENPKEIWKNEYNTIYKSYTGFKDMLNTVSLDEEVNLDGTKLTDL